MSDSLLDHARVAVFLTGIHAVAVAAVLSTNHVDSLDILTMYSMK
jgi:hypothetical protein